VHLLNADDQSNNGENVDNQPWSIALIATNDGASA